MLEKLELIQKNLLEKKINTLESKIEVLTKAFSERNMEVAYPLMSDEDKPFYKGANKTRKQLSSGHVRTEVEGNWVHLINYTTTIAIRAIGSNKVYFTKQRYSQTTSRVANQIKSELQRNGAEIIDVDESTFREMISTGHPLETATDVSFE